MYWTWKPFRNAGHLFRVRESIHNRQKAKFSILLDRHKGYMHSSGSFGRYIRFGGCSNINNFLDILTTTTTYTTTSTTHTTTMTDNNYIRVKMVVNLSSSPPTKAEKPCWPEVLILWWCPITHQTMSTLLLWKRPV